MAADAMLAGRIAVVTGASRGIGRAAALALAGAGAHIVAIARTQGALEELDDAVQAVGASATLVPLDLTDYDAIDRLGAAIDARWGRLDIVVGNAGILGNLMPIGHVTPKIWQQVMDVNVTANWRLIRSLDPLLQRSESGRAIFVTSGAATKCRPYWGPYCVSKAALDALVRTYAAETERTAIRVMLLNPGPLRTAMRLAAMPGEDPATLKTPEDLAPSIVAMAGADWQDSGKIFDYPTGRVLSFRVPE